MDCRSAEFAGMWQRWVTKEEALERIKEAIQLYIEALEIDGLPVPDEYPDFEIATVELVVG